jgi:hypothetical protein
MEAEGMKPVVTTRPAKATEVAYLQGRLASTKIDPVDLSKSFVYIVEVDDYPAGFVAAHLAWRVEPLFLFPEFQRRAPMHLQRRATLALGREIEAHIRGGCADLQKYFAFMREPFAKLAEHFGMVRRPADEVTLERSIQNGRTPG